MKIISGGKLILLLIPLLLYSCEPGRLDRQNAVSGSYAAYYHEMPNDSVRFPGSPQEAAAANAISDIIQQIGLHKFFDDTGYFHEFDISSGMRYIEGENYIRFMNREYTFENGMVLPQPSSPDANIEAPVCWVGYGIRNQNYNDLEGIDLNGKLALIMDGNPAFIKQPISLRQKIKALADAGAVGVIVVPGKGDSSFLKRQDYIQPGSPLPIPVMKITQNTARNLISASGHELDKILSEIDSRETPDSFTSDLRVTLFIRQTKQRRITRNIAGFLKGTADSTNYIVVIAPYDYTQNGSLVNAEDAALLKLIYDSKNKSGTHNLLFLSAAGRNSGLSGIQAFLKMIDQTPLTINSVVLLHHISDADSLQLMLVAKNHMSPALRTDSAGRYLNLSRTLPLSAGPIDSLLYSKKIPFLGFYGEKKSRQIKTSPGLAVKRLAQIEREIQLLQSVK